MTQSEELNKETQKRIKGLENWARKTFSREALSLIDQTIEIMLIEKRQAISSAKEEERERIINIARQLDEQKIYGMINLIKMLE